MKRIPELDGLRGLAILMVLIYHYGGWTWGWTGVDLFFVLSGFLIGGILMDAKNSSNYYSVFYTRRFFRIVPLYAVTIALLPLLLATHYEWFTSGNKIPWYAYATFTQNFWMAGLERLGTMALAVTWSLAIEEQFYLTLPLIVRNVSREGLIRICVYGIALAPVLRISAGLLYPHNWILLWALMPMRMDALLLGVLVACIVRDATLRSHVEQYRVISLSIVFAGVALLYVYASSVYNPLMQSIGYTWTALFYSLLLFHVVTCTNTLAASFMRMKWLGWIGGLAYGIYLIHETILGLVFGVLQLGEPNTHSLLAIGAIIASFAITIMIAYLSWHHFEHPLVKLGAERRYHEVVSLLDISYQPVGGCTICEEFSHTQG